MRTKTKKFRGSMTHGRGKKGGRGAGLKGGKGMAGGLKHRYMWVMKHDPNHFGRYGFKRHPSIKHIDNTINVGKLEEEFPGMTEINLESQGFDKLLGGGSITTALTVKVGTATPRAIQKIEDAGGKVTTPEEDFEEDSSDAETGDEKQ